MNSRILFVDDDANLLDAIQRTLHKQFTIDRALSGAEGLEKIASGGPYALVVADMQMPVMSGVEFLRKVRVRAPDTVRIMLTGNSDQKTAMDAVNDGHVFRFLTKPCPPPNLIPALESGLAQHRLVMAERELLENTLGGAVKILSEVLATSDPASFERSHRLQDFVRAFMTATGEPASWELELAAMLSQIGRVTVPPAVLEKVRDQIPLSDAETSVLERVPAFSARLLENIPRLEQVVAIVRLQNKHFDGSGFPDDPIFGGKIPLGARILKVLGDLLDLELQGCASGDALQQMHERIGCYDPELLLAVDHWRDVSLSDPKKNGLAEPEAMRIDQIKCGQVLAEDLRTRTGLLLMAANTKLTPMFLAKLLNFATLHAIDDTLLVYAGADEI